MKPMARLSVQPSSGLLRGSHPWQVQSLSWRLPGGAAEALLQAEIEEVSRFDSQQARRWLGSAVDIYNNIGENIWQGWIAQVQLDFGRLRLRWSTQRLLSRVIARYSQSSSLLNPIPEWQISDWVADPDNLAWLGQKEALITLDQSDADSARQAAKNFLLAHKLRDYDGLTVLEQEAPPRLELGLQGWWQRLDWILDGETDGIIAHLPGGKSQQNFGLNGTERLAQSFLTADEDFLLGLISLRVAMQGDAEDEVRVSVHADQNGTPGTSLASSSLPNYRLQGGWHWLTWVFEQPLLLSAHTRYWLMVKRSGNLNNNQYFTAETDDGRGYADGSLYAWNGSQWNFIPQDLRFCLQAVADSSELMRSVAQQAVEGGVLSGIQIWQESGIAIPRWRAIEKTRREALEGWLQRGCQTGERLSALVNPQRILEVFPLPRAIAPDLLLDDTGRLLQASGNAIPNPLDLLGRQVVLPLIRGSQAEIITGVKWERESLKVTVNSRQGKT